MPKVNKKTNIIFMLIDDLGWRDLSCYGSEFYETPNIDKLASEGMRFTNAYAACPVCSPTRASIMSGKYPARVGLTDFLKGKSRGQSLPAEYIHQLSLEEKSIASALRDGGYKTWHIGKWHLGESDYWPDKHGFDVNKGGCDKGAPNKGYFVPYHIPTLKDGPEGEYLTDRLTDEAVKLIEGCSNDEPFFMNFWHYTVHTPIQAKKEHIDYFTEKARRMGLDKIDPFIEGEYFPTIDRGDKRVIRRVIQSNTVYAAMIKSLDESVGRLMDTLKATGKVDNTIFIFTSDNGGESSTGGSPTCNLPLAEGKGWMYEGGVREPLIVHWPGVVVPGSLNCHYISSPDFYPLMLEIAGLPLLPEQHKDGVSFMPLLKGQYMDRGPIYWHYPHYGNQGGRPYSSVRWGEWKLIEFLENGRLELYNVVNDISEKSDRLNDYPEIAEKLKKSLAAWREDAGAKMPVPNPEWQNM